MIKIITYNEQRAQDFANCIIGQLAYLVSIDRWKVLQNDPKKATERAEEIAKQAKEQKGKIFLAYDNTKCVGCVVAIPHLQVDVGYGQKLDRGVIHELFVAEAYRGRGIGKKLLKKAEVFLEKSKIATIGLSVLEDNEYARGFYDSQGYVTRSRYMVKRVEK